MAGTAVLYRNEHDVLVLEGVEKDQYEEIKKQCNCENCSCVIDNKKINLGKVHIVGYKEEQIDWDYGY